MNYAAVKKALTHAETVDGYTKRMSTIMERIERESNLTTGSILTMLADCMTLTGTDFAQYVLPKDQAKQLVVGAIKRLEIAKVESQEKLAKMLEEGKFIDSLGQ